jgi:hypothetical protein
MYLYLQSIPICMLTVSDAAVLTYTVRPFTGTGSRDRYQKFGKKRTVVARNKRRDMFLNIVRGSSDFT